MDRQYWRAIGYSHNPTGLSLLYAKHNHMILQAAASMDREVLVFNVKQGWEPLCHFLGKEVPQRPFPNMNNETMFTTDLDFFRKIMISVAALNALKYIALAISLAYMVRWGLVRLSL